MPYTLEELRKMRIGKERWFNAVDMSSHDQEAAGLYSSVPDILDALIQQLEWRESLKKKIKRMKTNHIAKGINLDHSKEEMWCCMECYDDDKHNDLIKAVLELINQE